LTNTQISDIESELRILREWVKANSRRLEELEASAFQLADVEEVIVVAIPKVEP
jgi:hypothetical protein